VLDEGEDVVPVLPSPEQPAEKAEPEGSIAPVPVQTLNTPLQLLAAPIQTLATTCPADLDGIKDALLAPLTTNPNLDYLSIIMSNFPIAGPALDKLLAGIYISDAELQAIDAILSQLQHIDFGNLADAVDAFAANLTGDFTTCTVAYLTGQGLNASLVNLTVVPYIKALSHILTTPNTTEYPKIAAENRYNFGLSMVLRAMDTKVDTLTNNPKLSEIIPLLSGLIEDMTHIDYLLNQQGHIYSSGSKAKNNVIGHEGIISALSGLNAYFNTTKLSITPQITGALTDIITPLETINQQTFVKVNTLLTTNGIAGLTGLATLLNDAQPAFTHLEAFFDAVQAQDRSTALTIAETDLLDDIDDFKNHLVGQKLLPIVQILAEAGVTELETRGRINTNGANQIKQGITDLLDPNQNTKTVLKALIQTLTATLNTNAIDAPTANNLACSATSGTVATGATTTLQLTAPANANEAWGYLAIVGNPDTTTGLYLLAGDLTDLELPTPNTGTYTVELMTIGKNNILNPASVWANVSGRGNAMPYTWKTITDKISGKISSLSTVPATRQSRITAALSLLESTILRTSVTTTLLSGVQNILKTRIAYINANAGQWIAVNENGYLKASEALELWEEINTLAKGGDTKGNFIASLLNPTEIITIKKTSTPIVDDVEVIGFS
jgi:hypothetical protein